MPETTFTVRWPDGARSVCYSPSLVVRDHLAQGGAYPLPDFLARSRTALTAASERVRERYGSPCPRALGQLAALERAGAAYDPAGTVVVEELG